MPRINYQQVSPNAVKALMGVSAYIETSTIEASLRYLVELRVSQINGCLYCIDMHSEQARQAGVSQQRLDCLPAWHEATFYTDRERAALEWAETVTKVSETHVPDAAFEHVKPYFTEAELVDLTVIIATMNSWNRIAISFRNMPKERD